VKKVAVVDYYKYVDGGWVRDYSKSCIQVENGSGTKLYSPSAGSGSYENCSISTDVTTLDEFIETIMNNGFTGMAFLEWTYDDAEKAYVNPENENHKMYRRGSNLFVIKNSHRIDVTDIGTTTLDLPEDFPSEYINNPPTDTTARTTVTPEEWESAMETDFFRTNLEMSIKIEQQNSILSGYMTFCDGNTVFIYDPYGFAHKEPLVVYYVKNPNCYNVYGWYVGDSSKWDAEEMPFEAFDQEFTACTIRMTLNTFFAKKLLFDDATYNEKTKSYLLEDIVQPYQKLTDIEIKFEDGRIVSVVAAISPNAAEDGMKYWLSYLIDYDETNIVLPDFDANEAPESIPFK